MQNDNTSEGPGKNFSAAEPQKNAEDFSPNDGERSEERKAQHESAADLHSRSAEPMISQCFRKDGEPVYNYISMLSDNITDSGSFQIPADWFEAFWNTLQALPMPALLLDQSHSIVFANDSCRTIMNAPQTLYGTKFTSLLSDAGESREAECIAERIFAVTTPQNIEVEVSGLQNIKWARLYYRPFRMDKERLILVLIEDLTAEKEKLELMEQHRKELLQAKQELDKANNQLRNEMREREKVAKQIEHAKREWERTFDAVPDLVSIVDMNHRIVRVNKALADRIGKSYDDIVGSYCFETVHKSSAPSQVCPHMDMAQDGQPHRVEMVDDYLGGVFDIAVSPLFNEKDELVGSVHVARDITEEKKTQKLLLSSGRARDVAELAGMAAHGFNNLLQTVMGGAQLSLTNLELGNFGDVKNTLDEIAEDLRQGARTVKRLNFLAQAYSESATYSEKSLDFSIIAHQALDMSIPWWKTLPEKTGVKITLRRDLGPDCYVRGDGNQLLELIVDLVKNAAEALPEGGVIDVNVHREGERVVLSVSDDGVGIPKEDLSKVFQPLWTTKGPLSAGLGLERVRNIVSRHKGSVSIDGAEGKGTTVTVVLPRHEVSQEADQAYLPDEPGKACRIILIDDREPVVNMLAASLEQTGHDVFRCLSGMRAVEVFSASSFDAVICDLGMPDMNGWEVALSLRNVEEKRNRPRTPFILLTGWGRQGLQDDMLRDCGVDAVLEKPIDVKELSRVIRRLADSVESDRSAL